MTSVRFHMVAFNRGFTLLAILFMIMPLLVAGLMTFSPGQFFDFPPDTLSGKWYHAFLNDSSWTSAILTSVIISISSASLALVIGVPSALWISMASKKYA